MTSFDSSIDHTKRQDWQTISLLGLVHASSHFYQLILPTLFWYLSRDFGYDYVQLGFLVTCFFLVSGLGQASSGFVVDRIGPAPVMFFGLGSFVVSALLLAMAPNYLILLLAAVIGGAGNSVFHPVDYSIINHRISAARLGHAFSIHGLTGNLGWAAAPLFITTLSTLFSWRVAVFSAAALIGFILFLSIWQRKLWGKGQSNVDENTDLSHQGILATLLILVKKPTLWGAFLFFAFSSIALSAVQNYTIPLLSSVYGLSQIIGGSTLSAYMVAAAVGMAGGGFLAGASAKSERIIFISLCTSGLLMLLLALNIGTSSVAVALVVAAGFFSGVAAPSRDMLVRKVTPKGATGTVYGLVYSGMDVGASIAPLAFGYMIDAQFDRGPWFGAALAFIISAICALAVAYAAQHITKTKAKELQPQS